MRKSKPQEELAVEKRGGFSVGTCACTVLPTELPQIYCILTILASPYLDMQGPY